MIRDPGKSISGHLNKTEILISNALSESVIMAALSKVGYTPERMAEARTLLDSATARRDEHVALAGAQKEATAAATAAKKSAVEAYQEYSSLAKGAFKKSKETLTKLGLDNAMPRGEAKFIAAGKTLFENAASDPIVRDAMLKYGYDDAKLQSEKEKLLAFEKADAAQKAAEGAAQNATDLQERAMKELKDWTAQFRKAAKIALKEKKQLLEKLGILVRATKTKAQRAAGKKAAATKAAKKSAGSK